jgi:nickel-dependent lactate racemase
VRLPYGTEGLDVEVPDSATVVDPHDLPALADESAAVTAALNSPASGPALEALVGNRRRIVVVFPDLTRPMPNRTVLPPILAELERLGAGPDRVELMCATGTHRRATPAEMSDLIGPDLFNRYQVHDHSATDDEHVVVGRVDGTDVRIDRRYVEADLRIVTGFVEPHFFAGFSGGPKGVCPGLADLDTVLEAHSRRRISDPRATWTVMDGNPVQDFVQRAAALAPPALSVDVTIDSHRRLTGVYCGPLLGAHKAACAAVLATSVTKVNGPFDVVVTTNGGHPLDRNLYQAVKGMAAAERVVAAGGTILVAAECGDGLPAGGAFERLLAGAATPADLLSGGASAQSGGAFAQSGGAFALSGGASAHIAEPSAGGSAPAEPDGWQTQVLGRVLSKARVWLRAGGLTDKDVRLAQLRPITDLNAAVMEALRDHGDHSKICVLVQGPLAVATDVTPEAAA